MSVLPVGFGSAVASGYQIERSLRFNSADSASLTRTFGTPTSRTTWTMNLWFKRSTLGTTQYIFHSRDAGNTVSFECLLNTTDNLVVRDYSGSGYNSNYVTTQVFRDPSAWYALTVRWDTTNATAANRCTIFINGVQITTFSTSSAPSQNLQSQWNVSGYLHSIGSFYNVASYYNGYITETTFVDGYVPTTTTRTVNGITETILTQLGEFSSSTGVWTPKAWTGSYGTNGFYLPFKTASQWSGYFDGSVDYLSVAHDSSLSPTGDFTIEFWAYTGSTALQEWVTKGYGIQIYSYLSNWYVVLSSSNNTTYFINGSFGAHSTNTWQHIAISRQGNTYRGFVNGVATTLGTSSSAPSTGTNSLFVGAIGIGATPYYATGYLSNLRIVNGTAVYTGTFTPPTSQLTAITNTSLLTCQSSTFVDNSTNAFTVTATGDARPQQFSPFTLDVTDDHSGTGNHWIPNNLDLRTTGAGADIMVDTPTSYGTDTGVGGEVRGNYCVLNTLSRSISTNAPTPTNGNLEYATPAGVNTTGWPFVLGSIGISSGKWYFEVDITGLETDSVVAFGFVQTTIVNDSDNTDQLDKIIGAIIRNDSVSTGLRSAVLGTYVTRDGADATDAVYQIAIDNDLGKLWIGKANTWYASGNPSAGTNEIGTFTSQSLIPLAMLQKSNTNGDANLRYNFGQRAFAYTAPSGFKALCTQNLTTPTIGATSTTQANDYFNTVIWTGDGNNPRTVSGVGFQPDFVWAKLRSAAASHNLYDAVRGVGNVLYSDLTLQEANNNAFGYLSAFNSDGFVASAGSTSNAYFNTLNSTYVAWNWKANGAGSTNSNGTVKSSSVTVDSGTDTVTWNSHGMSDGQKIGFFAATMPGGLSAGTLYYVRDAATNTFKVAASSGGAAIDITSNGTTVTAHTTLTSTVSANTTAGFSIVKHINSGAPATIEHGLGVAPKFIINKVYDRTENWRVYYGTSNKLLILNSTNGEATDTNIWNNTNPTSNVFSIGTYFSSGDDVISYCFAPVAGYSAFGSYTGNGDPNGPFVYTGFRPRYILVKRTDSADNWAVYDTARDLYNQSSKQLRPDATTNELDPAGSPAVYYDFLSNGFKNRGSNSQCNANGGLYIYAAFAESPFKYSLAR